MTAYESADFDDLCQRLGKGDTLTDKEQRRYNYLNEIAHKEWENKPQAFMYGGDYADVF